MVLKQLDNHIQKEKQRILTHISYSIQKLTQNINYKLLEETIGENLCLPQLGKGFLDTTPKG